MKIVHVLTRLLRGGSEENTLACCSAQVRRGHAAGLRSIRTSSSRSLSKYLLL